jgi:hypothetical protein
MVRICAHKPVLVAEPNFILADAEAVCEESQHRSTNGGIRSKIDYCEVISRDWVKYATRVGMFKLGIPQRITSEIQARSE